VARANTGYAIDLKYTVSLPPDRPRVRVLLDSGAWGAVVNQRRTQAGGLVTFTGKHYVLNAPGPNDGQLAWAFATEWPDDFGPLLIPGLLPWVVPAPRPRPGRSTVPAMRIAVNVEAHAEAPTLIGVPAEIGGRESSDSDLVQAVLVRNPVEAPSSGPGRILVTDAVLKRWPGALSTPMVEIVGRVRDRLVTAFAWPPIPAIVLAESHELRLLAKHGCGLVVEVTDGFMAWLRNGPEWVEEWIVRSLASYWWGFGIVAVNRDGYTWLTALRHSIALDYARTHLSSTTVAQMRTRYAKLRDAGLVSTVRSAMRGELSAERFATRTFALGERFATDRERMWGQVAALARELWGQVVVDPNVLKGLLRDAGA
jgi:hypothetical protein